MLKLMELPDVPMAAAAAAALYTCIKDGAVVRCTFCHFLMLHSLPISAQHTSTSNHVLLCGH